MKVLAMVSEFPWQVSLIAKVGLWLSLHEVVMSMLKNDNNKYLLSKSDDREDMLKKILNINE